MRKQMIRAQLNVAGSYLTLIVEQLDAYLDYHQLDSLMEEQGSKEKRYYRSLLKSLRRLEVFCDEAKDAIAVLLQSEGFKTAAAERTLYGIYHQCIAEFFAPKSDTWYEDSRAAYTGESAILYHHEPPLSFKKLMLKLESSFQKVRQELECYETTNQSRTALDGNKKEGPAS